MRLISKFFHHLWADTSAAWHSMLAVYYLTYHCNFRCPYCSDGAQNPYYKLRSPVLPGHTVIELLRIIRRHSDFLVLTGGEPLQHPDFEYIMAHIKSLRFQGVILTTNGYAVDSFLPVIAQAVDYLIFSLDTLDPDKADAWFGAGFGTFARIMENIERAAAWKSKKYKIVVSSVATPENLEDLYAVYHYAQKHGFGTAICPQLIGVKAHPALSGNPAYRRLYDFLLAEKKKGGRVQGTPLYLQYMRDLRYFHCRPFTMLTVAPTGEVFYPCLELAQVVGNLLEINDLHDLRRRGEKSFGRPTCDTRCHSACALGFSLALNFPLSILHEAGLNIKNWLR